MKLGVLLNLNIIPTSDIIDHRKHVAFKNNSTWIFPEKHEYFLMLIQDVHTEYSSFLSDSVNKIHISNFNHAR
jgi:hypothetical protein